MTRGQVVEKLRSEGFAATAGRIRQALMHGYLQPLPAKGSRGAHQFARRHLQQLRRYFVQIRPSPQPEFAEQFPICGTNDRLHRLARKKQWLRQQGPSESVLREQRRCDLDAAIRHLENSQRR